MTRRYRVTYSSEDGRRHAIRVWASGSTEARKKVEHMEEADYVVHVRRANGPVIAALILLGIVALLVLSAVL